MPAWVKSGEYTSIEDMLMKRSGMTMEEILDPQPARPESVENLEAAAQLILEAVDKKQPVLIIGDYDADGMTATTILVKLLVALGVSAEFNVPKRFTDGYGLSERLIDGVSNTLIITVDNGVTAYDAVHTAKRNRNTIIVLDHHLPQGALPEADCIVDPHVHPERNGYEYYCGAGLAYKLVQLIAQKYAGRGNDALRKVQINACVLACVATLADVMPLTGDNRRIVMDGLKIVNSDTDFAMLSSGIRAILNLAERPFTEETIKMTIAPILNATGRLYNAGSLSVIKALLCDNCELAYKYAEKMQDINAKRKALVSRWQQEASQMMDCLGSTPFPVIYCKGIPEGLVGVVAGKLANDYKRPVFVMGDSRAQTNTLKGSGRTYDGFDMSKAVEYVRPLLESAGGHTGAAGISLKRTKLSMLRNALGEYMKCCKFVPDETQRYDMEVNEDKLPEFNEILKKYAPYGEGFPQPVVYVKPYHTQVRFNSHYRTMGRDQTHLKLNGSASEALAFGAAQKYINMGMPRTVELLGNVKENHFNDKTTIQVIVKDFRKMSEGMLQKRRTCGSSCGKI